MPACMSRRNRKKEQYFVVHGSTAPFLYPYYFLTRSVVLILRMALCLNVVGQVLGLEVHHEGVVLGHFSFDEVGIDAGTLGEE